MAGLEIALVVIGVLIFVGSFFVTEKLSSSDMAEITKVSEKEIKNVVDKRLAESEGKIKERFDDKLEDAVSDFAVRTDDEYVAKMNQLNEFSEKVLDSAKKSEDEIVFIYSMLNDKQEKVTELTAKMDITQSQLLQLKSDVEDRIVELQEQYKQNLELKKEQEFVTGIEAARVKEETVKTFEDDLIERINEEVESAPEELVQAVNMTENISAGVNAVDDNINASTGNVDSNIATNSNVDTVPENEIVKLYKEGYSEIEIAKKLGKGIGEIRLILGLYS